MKKTIVLFFITNVLVLLLLVMGCAQGGGSSGGGGSGGGDDTAPDPFAGIMYRDMVSITGGTFDQQSDINDDGDVLDANESFSHTISNFLIGKYEVTYELWYKVYQWAIINGYTFANAGKEGHDGTVEAAPIVKYEPVTTINWRDAIVWCNAYSWMAGLTPVYYTNDGFTTVLKNSSDGIYGASINNTAGSFDNPYVNWSANGYRLPTEGEWQYTASNKGATPYNYASGAAADYTDAIETQKVAWYSANSGNITHNVGTTTNSNALTLWDMSGNVGEWCWDWYSAPLPGAAQTDYRGPVSGASRIGKGGTWFISAKYSQVSYHSCTDPFVEVIYVGFRISRSN